MFIDLVFSTLLSFQILVVEAAKPARTTRSWNCCKPSCSWLGKADVTKPVTACDRHDTPLEDYNQISSCNKPSHSGAFACAEQHPWELDDTTSYGFAAVHINGQDEKAWCCACYSLTFTSELLPNRTMVVQAVDVTYSAEDTFDLRIPGGTLGAMNSCTDQNPQYRNVSSDMDCDKLPPALRSGCQWRFDWFKSSDNPLVSYEQVKCPTAITDKTGCLRNDDQFQNASTPLKSPSPLTPSPPSTPSSSPQLKKSSISENAKFGVAICVPTATILLSVAAYWLLKRRRTRQHQSKKSDTKIPPETLIGSKQLEPRAQPVINQPHTGEMFPVYIQDLDNEHMHRINAVAIHELEISPGMKMPGSTRWTIVKYTKPLPNIPIELKGSSVCELDGEYGSPWI